MSASMESAQVPSASAWVSEEILGEDSLEEDSDILRIWERSFRACSIA